MVFHQGEYAGTATEQPYPYLTEVEQPEPGRLALHHAWAAPGDEGTQRTWSALATVEWDEEAGEILRGVEVPPMTEAEVDARHADNLATGLPEKINGIYPGAGGPAPGDAITLGPSSTEDREWLASPMVQLEHVVAVFSTTSPYGIGCSFHEGGDVLCGSDALYDSMALGRDEYDDVVWVAHLPPRESGKAIGLPMDFAAWGADQITVPTVQNGEPVRWGDTVCAMAADEVTCWDVDSGHGFFLGENRITKF